MTDEDNNEFKVDFSKIPEDYIQVLNIDRDDLIKVCYRFHEFITHTRNMGTLKGGKLGLNRLLLQKCFQMNLFTFWESSLVFLIYLF